MRHRIEITTDRDGYNTLERLWKTNRHCGSYRGGTKEGQYYMVVYPTRLIKLFDEYVKMKNILDRLGFTLEDLE